MDHTLIIPTKNRPSWLFFALNCLKEFNYKGKIVIIDGSKEVEHSLNNQYLEKFKNSLNLQKFRENYSESITHKNINLSKYNFFKNSINTKYFTIMNDDDCFFPDFAKYGIKFLEENSDFSAITGIEINNYLDKNFKIKKYFVKVYPEFLSKDPLDRILYYATKQNQTLPIFGVCRTSIMSELFEYEKNYNLKPFCREKIEGLYSYDQEMPWQLHIILSGKIKVSTNHIMNVRNRHDSPTRDTNLRFQKNHIAYMGPIELIKNKTLGDFIEEHLLELNFLIKNKTKYDNETVEKVLKRIIWKFISRENGSGLHTEKTDFNNYLKDYQKDFKKISINIPKINKILSINFFSQIKNKISKFLIIFKINIMAKPNFHRYKKLIENFNKL